ncbi:hypothetical protein RCO28_02395 [Streptomyces sp. LHD-70]|uniref:hypothetical protein n=1 Tax=Streptomyces sp. LHD-70 TaxID=3072140 RepID=UPI00280C8B3F|nr:hypothetical protein [Streptomyces sp. LHD-70]MDQ8701338.1 hypothetical protein [Streptomyces sp. LHD-70]
MSRPAAAAAAVTVLAVTASGCVTVHGEREILPAATKAEAARALKDFTKAYNAAEAAADPAKDAKSVTGPFGAINQAGLKARAERKKDGDEQPASAPLKLDDAKFTIPKQAGWPRWFVADTDSNKDKNGSFRWVMVFTRGGLAEPWEASYLAFVPPGKMPEFKKDKDGFAEPVDVDDKKLAVAPKNLSEEFASYLKEGGETFQSGPYTSTWRTQREKAADSLGLATQYIDEPQNSGTYAPVGLRTKDGGALVFFSTRHFEKRTAAEGLNLRIGPDVRALMTGDAKSAVTLEYAAGQTAVVPPKGASTSQVQVLNRVQGLTGAKGE